MSRKGHSPESLARGVQTRTPSDAAWRAVRGIPGITYRKYDHWCHQGYIRFSIENDKANRSGNWRVLSESEVQVVALLVELTAVGIPPATAVPIARSLVEGEPGQLGRFLIVGAPSVSALFEATT